MLMSGITTRGMASEKFKNIKTPHTWIVDATRLWIEAPISIRQAKSIQIAKKEAKKILQYIANLNKINIYYHSSHVLIYKSV